MKSGITVSPREQEDLIQEKILVPIDHMLSSAVEKIAVPFPVVTVSYAQSLDGCIALNPGEPFTISGEASLKITHGLRAMHDAILVGIGTVLSDNPRLTVRLQEGRNPLPVILDSKLRFPPDTNLLRNSHQPVIAVTPRADPAAVEKLRSRGADIMFVNSNEEGQVRLPELLQVLFRRNIRTVMVEGGSRILTSFFREQLVNQVVLTIAPKFLGGVPAMADLTGSAAAGQSRLHKFHQETAGEDLILWGSMDRDI